ncbi:MAG: hypothetical protein AUI45_14420 [Acidobacteria bacterium 13_1_40CM_2_56_11]|nr:MAG: hypothetical protein AUI45_14420 [Acidobacteria bacterium 13_1_40CM_2_56_11]
MALRIATQNLGYRDMDSQIEKDLQNVFKDRKEDWSVTILGAQNNTKWEMTINGPNSYLVRHTLYGEDGGHNPKYIAALLAAEFNSLARETNLVIAELIREDAQYNIDGIAAGFIVIDGVNVRTADAIAMRMAGKLTHKEIWDYAKRAKA